MEIKLPKNPDDFEIVCHNYTMKETTERFRPYMPFSYIEVLTSSSHVGEFDILFESKRLDFGNKPEDPNPVVSMFYPYDIPALVKVLWYNDTYCGVSLLKCVDKRGWI